MYGVSSSQSGVASAAIDERASFAHRTRLAYAISGNALGLYWFLSLEYPVERGDLLEALTVGRVKSLADILCAYLERGVEVSDSAIQALARRWIDCSSRRIDFPGMELMTLLEAYLQPSDMCKARKLVIQSLLDAPLWVRQRLKPHVWALAGAADIYEETPVAA